VTVLVDSDILIEISRGRDRELIGRWTDLSGSDHVLLYSPVTAAELWAGARPGEHEVLDHLFRAFICVPIDGETGRIAGDYLRRYRKSHGVEIADALIAAAAWQTHASLWTRNRKHYPMREVAFF
jgi:predicted nucleic acid-binding protein